MSATIADSKTGGDPWDNAAGTGAAPDPVCEFWMGASAVARTSILSNTFTPSWDESITPGSRFTAALLSSQQPPWFVRVSDDDGVQGADPICSTTMAFGADAFASKTAKYTNLGGCTTLSLILECLAN